VGLLLRHPLPAAICGLAVAIVAGVFVFARPRYHAPHQGTNVKIPDKRPAADAAGAAGWVWPDGVPGWAPGETIGGYPVSQLQPVEVQPAQLAAAHFGLDAGDVRVLEAMHVARAVGPIAVLAAPTRDVSPQMVCLAVPLPHGSTVEWRCPGLSTPYPDVAKSPVLVGADYEARGGFFLVGVARGDVERVVLHVPDEPQLTDMNLYERGATWGQFSAAVESRGSDPQLLVYGDHGLLERLSLALRPGEQRIFG